MNIGEDKFERLLIKQDYKNLILFLTLTIFIYIYLTIHF